MLFSEYHCYQIFYTPKMKKQKPYLQHHKALTQYPHQTFVGDGFCSQADELGLVQKISLFQ